MSISITLKKAFLTWLKKLPSGTASSQRQELYLRCNQLPFHNFLRCLIDGDLSELIISGEHNQGELAQAWTNIYYEYVSLSDDTETKYFLYLQKDVVLLHNEIITIETNIYFLSPVMMAFSIDHRDELIQSIKDFGYKINIDFSTDYTPTLDAILNKLAPKKQKLANKEKELLQYIKAKEGQTVDLEYFEMILLRLSKYQGYPVRTTEITVSQYVTLLKDYVRSIESSKKEDVKHG